MAGAVLRSPSHTEALSDPREAMAMRKGSKPRALTGPLVTMLLR